MAFFHDLLRRRIPQMLVIYVGSAWGLVQFVDFVAQRYALSPHLIDLALVVPLLMLPSVLLVTYFHGAPGADKWVTAEKVGIPINLVVAALWTIGFVQGKDLGAATTTVTVTDEEGVETERVVPKSEFRKRIAVFFFDAPPDDTAAAWLEYGLADAVVTDLFQDHFIDAHYPPHFADRLQEAGFTDLTGVPLSLQREIAEERHRDQFVRGEVAVVDGEIQARVSLYDVARGKVLEEHSFTGSNVLELADEIAGQIRRDLKIPDLGENAVQDLPASQVLTESPEAYRKYIDGQRLMTVDRDFAAATAALEEAVAIDPTFALAQLDLGRIYAYTNRPAESVGPMQAAMDHVYRVPERLRFAVKSDYYYLVRQDVDKSLAALEMWADIFPDDILAYQARVLILGLKDDRPAMLATLEKILELDPNQKDVLLQIGELNEAMGNLEAAREAFQEYADEFPDDHRVLAQLAGVSRQLGDLDQARDYYDRALLLEPSNVDVLTGMAGILRAQGDFEGAAGQLRDAEATASTPMERAGVHGGWRSYYSTRGQMAQALVHAQQQVVEISSALPGLQALQAQVMILPEALAEAGRTAEATAMVGQVRAQLSPPFDGFASLGETAVALAREEEEGVAAAIPGVEAFIQQLRLEALRAFVVHAQGRLHELRGEYAEAIAMYEQERTLNPGDPEIPMQLGRCHRELGNLERAVGLLQESLNVSPWAPRTNYEIALAYEAMGRTDDARRHLERAVDIWAQADEGYEPAQEARAALARITG